MHAPRASFFSTHRRTILALLFGLAFSATLAYAVPPASQYTPGETLDPACAPGSTNCSVLISGGGATYTFSTGLTESSNTVTNNLSTGVSGGQSVVGGTGAAENLTLTSTSNATKGTIIFGTSAYNEDTNQLGIGTTAPNTILDIVADPGVVAMQITDGGNSFFTVNAVAGNVLAIGSNAGLGATSAAGANFIGFYAGNDATSAVNSNFFGTNAGLSATSAATSNFIGYSAGVNATNASNSNFLGQDTGASAANASLSNFFGYRAGFVATNASNSNFFGFNAGFRATDAADSNFLGQNAGIRATDATNANFFGANAGRVDRISAGNASDLGSINSANAIFIGANAGYFAADVNLDNSTDGNDYSILLGQNTSTGGFENSIAIGSGAINTATNQLVIGSTTRTISSILVGGNHGTMSTNIAIAFGRNAGSDATNAFFSNFFGNAAGYQATGANNSNFVGNGSGASAASAVASNFFGNSAGNTAINASSSSFFGHSTGANATNAARSVFLGAGAGSGATNAANAIFMGLNAGVNDTVNNTGDLSDYSILIGPYASTGGFENSIAIGRSATNTASNEFMIGSTTRRIETMVFNSGSGNTCSIVAGSGISCSSDERLKTNIEELETDTLEKLLSLRTVRYNWNTNPDGDKMIGFIAQDLESPFPELIMHNNDGMLAVNYAQMTPILVEAIREINAKIVDISDIEIENNWRTALTEWFASATNGIGDFFAKKIRTEMICVKKSDGSEVCLDGDQLESLGNGGDTIIIPQTPSGESQHIDVVQEDDTEPTPEVIEESGEEESASDPALDVEETTPEPTPDPAPTE